MKKYLILPMIIVIISFLIFNGCAEPAPAPTPAPTPAPAEPIELSFSNFFPPVAGQGKLWQAFCDDIEKRSEGGVKISYYPGGSLLGGPESADGVKEGIADMSIIQIAYTPGRFPVSELANVVTGFPSAIVSSRAVDDFYREFKPKEWDAYHILAVAATGPFLIFSKEPIHNLEEYKGVKVRVTGRHADQTKVLGGVPVGMPAPEAYDALSKGVIDGAVGPYEFGQTWRAAEVCKYVTLAWRWYSPATWYTAMNKNSYDKLPQKIQALFDEVATEYVEKAAMTWNDADVSGSKFAKEKGVEVIELTPEEAAAGEDMVQSVIDLYIKDTVERGFSEQDIQKWMNYIKSRIAYRLDEQIKSGVKSPVGPEEIRG